MTTKKQKQNEKTADKQALAKKEDRTIIKKMTLQEARDFIDRVAYMDGDPKSIMKKLSEDILPRIKAGKRVTPEITKMVSKALMSYGLDTHYPLAETVDERYRPLAIEFSRQLIQEFDCRTSNEKALAQIVVSAYIGVIDGSRRFNNCLRAAQYLSDERTKYLAVISKQLDRANRQFITALATLKQFKTPSFEINVKTKAAFVAQNQQLNINPSNKDENVEPK